MTLNRIPVGGVAELSETFPLAIVTEMRRNEIYSIFSTDMVKSKITTECSLP